LTLAGCLSQVFEPWPQGPVAIDPSFRELSIRETEDEFVVGAADEHRLAAYEFKRGGSHLVSSVSDTFRLFYREDRLVDAYTKARYIVRGEVSWTPSKWLHFGTEEREEEGTEGPTNISMREESGGSVVAFLATDGAVLVEPPFDKQGWIDIEATKRGKTRQVLSATIVGERELSLTFNSVSHIAELRHTEKGDVWYQYPDGGMVSVVGDSGQVAQFVLGREIGKVLGMDQHTTAKFKAYFRPDVDNKLQEDILRLLIVAYRFRHLSGGAPWNAAPRTFPGM
jgi:hypothetical protein